MHRFCLGYALLLILALSRIGDASQCGPSGDKSCICANSIMDCRDQKISEFPTIANDIKAVHLENNQLTSLKRIPGDPELQTLILSQNKIKSLDFDTFDNLDNLKTLYLSNNEIKVISDDIFEWNPLKLEVLYLDGNKLEFIQHFLFYDLEELTDLYLQNNEIVFIHPHAFLQLKNLRNLRLDGNQLHTFNHKWIDKLQANMFTNMRFDNNKWSCDCAMNHSLSWLGKKKSQWFHELTHSQNLTCLTPSNLTGTHFKNLNTHQVDVMKQCDMPQITGISKPTTLYKAQTVKLRCQMKDEIYPVPTISWTAPNRDVYRLNTAISYDGIDVGIDGSLLITNLSIIDNGTYVCNASNSKGYHTATTALTIINKTNTETPDHETPDHTPVMETPDPDRHAITAKRCAEKCQCLSRHVDCSGDGSDTSTAPWTKVPVDIQNDALTISLAGNEIASIGSKDFNGFHDLEELKLDDNAIVNIDYHAFNALTKLTTLSLQKNKLVDIQDKTFSKLKKLTVLVLDHNKITKLKKNMFEGLHALKWLYIRHNEITHLDADTFSDMLEIRFIHLESNELLSLPSPQYFLSAKKLMKVFVDENNFQCNHDMESVRIEIRNATFQSLHPDFYGDGIKCSSPPKYFDEYLADIKTELKNEAVTMLPAIPPSKASLPPNGSYSGLLFGGIVVGVVLTFVIFILWRKYGRTLRTKGRSYNYSDLRGNDDNERNGLTDNMGGQEAFV